MPRDDRILFERIGGATSRQVAERYGLSHEGVRFIYTRAREAYIDVLERQVRRHLGTNDRYELAIPPPFRDDPDGSARYVGWVTGALAERGVHITSATFGVQEATR